MWTGLSDACARDVRSTESREKTDEASIRDGEPRPIGDMDREPGGVRVEARKDVAAGLGLGRERLATDWDMGPSRTIATRAARSGLVGMESLEKRADRSCLEAEAFSMTVSVCVCIGWAAGPVEAGTTGDSEAGVYFALAGSSLTTMKAGHALHPKIS